MVEASGYSVSKIRSKEVSVSFLEAHKDCFFIISNFALLTDDCKNTLSDLDYLIYEHDHKYIRQRNPAFFKDFQAPLHEIVNYYFYKNAKKIICQSDFHKEIIKKNLQLDNIISVGGNLWPDKILEKIRLLSKNNKDQKYSIMGSNTPHKNTQGSVKHCVKQDKQYEVISDKNYEKFLEKLSRNEGFVFLPKSPETLSRVVVEARMLGCKVITNQMVGAAAEEWFNLKGEHLIEYMFEKKKEIASIVENIINDTGHKEKKPKVSIISTFYKAEEFLEGFLEDVVSQTIFEECELIIIDSGSPGREREIVESYCEKHNNIKYIRYENRFPPTKGHNIGMLQSRSKYITWAMIDDRKAPDFLETLYNELEANRGIDLVYGNCLTTSNKNEKMNETKSQTFSEHSLNDFSRENMIKCLPGPMPMWTTGMINKAGFFNDIDYDFCDDWELWLRAVDKGSVFKKVHKIVGLYLEGGRSQIQNNLAQRKEEAEVFFKYRHVFGSNYDKFFSYFKQFLEISE